MSRLQLGLGRRGQFRLGLKSSSAGIPSWVDPNAVYDYDFFNNRYWPAPATSDLTDVRASLKYGQYVGDGLTQFGNNVLAITNTLSVEPAGSNAVGQTQTFDNASWSKSQATVTADQAVAPDGTMTADLVAANGTSNPHQIGAFVVATATPYEASVYVKPNTALFFHFLITGANLWVQFDLTTGAVVFSSAGTGTLTSTSAVLLANGYWDLRVRFTQSSGSAQTLRFYPLAASQNNGGPSETSTASVYLWGANLKTTGMGTSYIPAVASVPTTRAADAITGVRIGASSVKYTFDDDTTQTIAGMNPNSSTLSIPTNLTRPLIKRLQGLKPALQLSAVATRGFVGDALNATKFQIMSHTHHDFRDTVTGAQVLFLGWCGTGATNVETNAGAVTSVTASYSLTGDPAGAWTPILFSGVATGSIPDGGELLSDAIPATFSNGQRIWIRHWKNCAAGLIGNNDTLRDDVAGEYCAYGVTTPDLTAGGVITQGAGACAYPAGIVGQTRKPTIGILGDSRAYGFGDTYDSAGEIGEVCRTIGPAFAYISTAKRSMNPGQFVASHTKRVALLKTYCTHIYSELGGAAYTNGASTTGQFQTDMTAVWGYFSPRKVYQSTMSITSTGAWTLADLSDQTATNQPNFQISNDWIRTTPSGLTGYFETADAIESSRNSGKWKADGTPLKYTIDGTHASQFGCLAIQASGAITLSSFWR